jgi:hypothetical protein
MNLRWEKKESHAEILVKNVSDRNENGNIRYNEIDHRELGCKDESRFKLVQAGYCSGHFN